MELKLVISLVVIMILLTVLPVVWVQHAAEKHSFERLDGQPYCRVVDGMIMLIQPEIFVDDEGITRLRYNATEVDDIRECRVVRRIG